MTMQRSLHILASRVFSFGRNDFVKTNYPRKGEEAGSLSGFSTRLTFVFIIITRHLLVWLSLSFSAFICIPAARGHQSFFCFP